MRKKGMRKDEGERKKIYAELGKRKTIRKL